MPAKAFLFLFFGLSLLAIITSPAVLGPFLTTEATPAATASAPTPLPTATPTLDLFADIPTATPFSQGRPPSRAVATPPPGLLSSPVRPDPPDGSSLPILAASDPAAQTDEAAIAPADPGPAPDRLYLPRLNRDLPVEAVGLRPSAVDPAVFEWGVPDHRAAGWLNGSAPFGVPGNTVLDGHHNRSGEAFRDLWTLQSGDEIILSAGGQSRVYLVSEVLILPERDQPLAVRLANAQYIRATTDERLTLITCWPYESNSHRVVVIAFPKV